MFNLKKVLLAVGSVTLISAAGCSSMHMPSMHMSQVQCPVVRIANTPPEPVNPTPLLVDEAMQSRDWAPVSAAYANGDTIAGPVGFMYRPRDNQPSWAYALEDAPLFVVQVAALPVTLVMAPPWKTVRWTGVTVEPSYTAMPALPPAPASEAAPMAAPTQPMQ